jgi:hypothetical protein
MLHALLAASLVLGCFQEKAPKVAGRLKGHARGEPLGALELGDEAKKLRPAIEKLRGETFRRDVPLVLLDEEGFAVRVREHVVAEREGVDRAVEGTVAKLLGVLPAGVDWEAEESAARERRLSAFYDPRADTLVVKAGLAPGTARVLLARGLCAALDDQAFDLEAFAARGAGNGDARRALEAVAKGASMGVMRGWALQNIGTVMPDDIEDATTQGLADLADAPPCLWKSDVFGGLQGASFLVRLEDFRKAGNRPFVGADLAAAFRDPPRSSEQVIHPEKYWDPALRDDPVEVRFTFGDLPEGWSVLGEDTLGEFGWGLVVEPADGRQGLNPKSLARVKFSFRSSIGWGGDRFLLLGREERRLLVCETAWDTPQDATEFAGALNARDESLRAAAQAYAAEHGLAEEGSGLEVARPDEQGLTLVVWAGVSDEERARVRDAIRAVRGPDGDGGTAGAAEEPR